MRSSVVVLVTLLLAAPASAVAAEGGRARAPRTTRYLPARTLAAVVVGSIDRTLAALEETNASRLWRDPEMRPFVDPLVAKLRATLAEIGAAGEVRIEDLASILRGEVALAVVGLRSDVGPEPVPELALVAEVADRDAVARLLQLAGRAIDRNTPARYTTREEGGWTFGRVVTQGERVELGFALSGSVLLMAVGPGGAILDELVALARDGEGDAGRAGGSLAGDRDLLAAIGRAASRRAPGARGIALGFLHWGRLTETFFDLAGRDAPAEQVALARRVYEALGLDGVRSVSFSLSVDPPGVRSEVFVHAPAPRRGVFKLVSEEPIGRSTLRVAPEGARSLVAWRWRPDMLVPLVRNVAAAVNAQAAEQLEQALKQGGAMVKAVGSFGDEGTAFLARANVEPVVELANAAVVIRVEDVEAFRPMFSNLVALGTFQAGAKGLVVKTATTAEGDSVIYLPLPLGFSPAATLAGAGAGDHLVIATTREGLERALKRLRTPAGGSLASGDDYELALAHALGGRGQAAAGGRRRTACFVYYSRPMRAADYAPYLALAPAGAALLYVATINVDVPQEVRDAVGAISIPHVPTPELLARYALPSVAVGWSDDEGLGLTGWRESILPGGGGVSLLAAAAAPVLAGAAIPELMKSRLGANENAAVATLRAYQAAQNVFHRTDFYGKGKLVYANPRDGSGFPDLYELGGPGAGGARLKLKLVDEAFARATRRGSAKAGYFFVDIVRDAGGARFDFTTDHALCAVPARHGKTGRRTFVIDVTGAVYHKDTRGAPVMTYPDLDRGWEPLEVW